MQVDLKLAGLHWRLLSAGTPGTRAGIAAQQNLLEGLPEYLVEDGVEDGVDHRAGVAQPRDHVEDPVADPLLALRTPWAGGSGQRKATTVSQR